jgi:hypothetical protein
VSGSRPRSPAGPALASASGPPAPRPVRACRVPPVSPSWAAGSHGSPCSHSPPPASGAARPSAARAPLGSSLSPSLPPRPSVRDPRAPPQPAPGRVPSGHGEPGVGTAAGGGGAWTEHPRHPAEGGLVTAAASDLAVFAGRRAAILCGRILMRTGLAEPRRERASERELGGWGEGRRAAGGWGRREAGRPCEPEPSSGPRRRRPGHRFDPRQAPAAGRPRPTPSPPPQPRAAAAAGGSWRRPGGGGRAGREGGLRCPPCRVESALAAAAVTTGETAAQVGEAAAADEEEGEAAAAAKGKRTALRGLGGIPPHPPPPPPPARLPAPAAARGPALPGARSPSGASAPSSPSSAAPPGSCPRWRGAGRPPKSCGEGGGGEPGAWPGLRGVGGGGPGLPRSPAPERAGGGGALAPGPPPGL